MYLRCHLNTMQLCRNDVPMEYSGEEQAICAMGLIRPRPGVFVEAIQYVLVLCTTVEVRDNQILCEYGKEGRQ